MPLNMNTGRFRTRRNCCHFKSNQSLEDLQNSTYYPCGISSKNDTILVNQYKNYINRGLEHVPYLEKKKCIIQQRKGLKKKTSVAENNTNNASTAIDSLNARAFSFLRNF